MADKKQRPHKPSKNENEWNNQDNIDVVNPPGRQESGIFLKACPSGADQNANKNEILQIPDAEVGNPNYLTKIEACGVPNQKSDTSTPEPAVCETNVEVSSTVHDEIISIRTPKKEGMQARAIQRSNGSGILGEEMSPIYTFPVLKTETSDNPPLVLPLEKTNNISSEENSTTREKFFMDQTVENLLDYCSSAETTDLAQIRKVLRVKLGMDSAESGNSSLPKDFYGILCKLTTRVHEEVEIHARVEMYKLFLDLAQHYKSDSDVFHTFVGFYYIIDERLDFHYFHAEEEKSDILLEEFEVLLAMNEWVTRTYYKIKP